MSTSTPIYNPSAVALLLISALLIAGCSGSGGSSTAGTGGPGDDDGNMMPNPSQATVASSQMPQVDATGQVVWPFAPMASNVELEVMPFVEMPVADSGRPGRWNDMEFTGERLFVSNEHDGRIYEITDRKANLWFDVAAAIQSATGRNLNIENPWHGGVRGFAFHPDFSSNGKFYVSLMQDRPANPAAFTYISDNSGVSADSVLVEWTANPGSFVVDASSYREVFRVGVPQYDHPIKQIAFNPYAQRNQGDYGLLYIAHGDGSAEASTAADGEGNNALGKILRVNPLVNGMNSYSIPPGNPFVGNTSMADEVYSLGHRNPHHLAFLPNGQLLATEAGHDNLEEINLIEAGANYGWSQREGAFVHLESGALANGITALPADDAANGFTYPVMQLGHTGPAGANFVGQALGGGFMPNNGSPLANEFFYVDFVRSGRLFHSSLSGILASQTSGDPAQLTMAQTFEASVMYDDDGDASTAAIASTMPDLLQSTAGYDGSGRVDVRIGQGPLGELYLLNKRNNVIYLVRNSYPPGRVIPALPDNTGEPNNGVTITRVDFDITVPQYMSNELQIRLTWGDNDLTAAWVADESWAASVDLPTNTENQLVVTFNDRNGELTLGSFERTFRTGNNPSETYRITASQFDTDSWDNDSDGASNLEELIAGADPLVSNIVSFAMVQEKLFSPSCDGCHDNRSPSGGLDLTEGNAYASLVGQPSSRKDGAILVIPNDPDNSYLVQKMEGGPDIRGGSMNYGRPNTIRLVRDWIAGGALND